MNANPDNLAEKLRELIKGYEYRQELGLRGRKFIEAHHEAGGVVEQLSEVYKSVLCEGCKVPHSTFDIDYLADQIA